MRLSGGSPDLAGHGRDVPQRGCDPSLTLFVPLSELLLHHHHVEPVARSSVYVIGGGRRTQGLDFSNLLQLPVTSERRLARA